MAEGNLEEEATAEEKLEGEAMGEDKVEEEIVEETVEEKVEEEIVEEIVEEIGVEEDLDMEPVLLKSLLGHSNSKFGLIVVFFYLNLEEQFVYQQFCSPLLQVLLLLKFVILLQ